MGAKRIALMERKLEHGSIAFYYRPRVDEQAPEEIDEVQRLLILLAPANSSRERLIAIGRRRLPSSRLGARLWGYVDLVLDASDMQAALGAQVYSAKTEGVRHTTAAVELARGSYELVWHQEHSHLRWRVVEVATDDPIATQLTIEQDGDNILTVANPDPTAWGLDEPPRLQEELFEPLDIHVTIPTTFPAHLQERFGDRRYAEVDSVEWLDHPGAELIFIGAKEQAYAGGEAE